MKATEMNKNANLTSAKESANVDKKKVYICSPYRPVTIDPILRANELIDNLRLAKDACTFAAYRGCEPIAPHLYYPQFLNDDDAEERELGMLLGLKALRTCDELWIVSLRISSGMSAEIKEAQKCGIPVKVFCAEGVRRYIGNGDMTDNCLADTVDGVEGCEVTVNKSMTFRELIAMVLTAKEQNSDRTLLVCYEDKEMQIQVYSSGEVYAKDYKHSVTFDLFTCTDYTYRFASVVDKSHIDADRFLDERWEVRLVMEAEDLLWKKKNGCN